MNVPFKFVLQVREKLYASGLLRTNRLEHPVISVGNLTMGGTGKTPLTIFLAEKLRDRGYRPVILSRGYGRATKGVVIVSRGAGPVTGWQEAGDEPCLMAKRLSGIAAVVVGERRHAAGQIAEREDLGDLFILDDGFQHRQLHRDVDLVAIDPAEWLAGEKLLPLGRWREPKSALARAHAACVNGDASIALPIPQFRVETVVDGIYRGNDKVVLETLRNSSIGVFAGIAKPERFFATVASLGLHINKEVSFRDHHSFTARDLAGLGAGAWITTEKDAVKLDGRGQFLTLRVSANIAEFDRLEKLILARLNALRS